MEEGGDGNEVPSFQSLVQFSSTNIYWVPTHAGLPWWFSGEESTCQCRRHGLDPWVGRISWRRKWLPTPVLLPGKSHGQRSLPGYSPWGHKRVGHDWATTKSTTTNPCWTLTPMAKCPLTWPPICLPSMKTQLPSLPQGLFSDPDNGVDLTPHQGTCCIILLLSCRTWYKVVAQEKYSDLMKWNTLWSRRWNQGWGNGKKDIPTIHHIHRKGNKPHGYFRRREETCDRIQRQFSPCLVCILCTNKSQWL